MRITDDILVSLATLEQWKPDALGEDATPPDIEIVTKRWPDAPTSYDPEAVKKHRANYKRVATNIRVT